MAQTVKDAPATSDGRDRRWDDHRQARRDHFLDTAISLIDAEGSGVGVAAMAKAAEMPRSVVYKLFGDRKDLDEHIRQRIVAEVSAAIWDSLVATGSIRDLVRGGVETYVEWVAAHPHLHRFIGSGSQSAPTTESRASRSGKRSFASRVRDLIEAAWAQAVAEGSLPPGVAEHLAYGAVGLVDSVVNRWLATGAKVTTTHELVAFLTDAICGIVEAGGRGAGIDVDVDAVMDLGITPE
ncbi:MAG: TetR/AcrR family transcriptional regulator [Aeromicrobium sp.]|uniref:TetR/AcrR family transcriptional regulator n=1 Tax=Aeromicrobium sp. TaxID=1871063 RepID=UPI0039E63393